MKNNLILVASLLSGVVIAQTPLFQVGNNSKFFVEENALVYNGGGLQTIGDGLYDIKGNVMVVGSSTDVLRTSAMGGGTKTNGGNIILRFNGTESQTDANASYGQLYITGLTQNNITGIVDKEFKTPKHGSGNYFQQVALPFFDKEFNTLSNEFGKTFGTTRYTQNEILKWSNLNVVSIHYTDLTNKTFDPTGYYMLGSRGNNLDLSIKRTLRGRPYADTENNMDVILKGAGVSTIYGPNGTNLNQYREPYNSYLQDSFDFGSGAWVNNNYGKNLYQFGNPFFTNLDLSKIGYVESAGGDGNQIRTIQGIRYDPGAVVTLPGGSSFSTGALTQTFVTTAGTTQGTPTGDVGLVIKPMQTFVIKLTAAANGETSSTYNELNFRTLRRFNNKVRGASINYHVTANKNGKSGGTVKQLGIKGLDSNGKEIARAYYVVYPEATSGHTTKATTQATNSSTNLMGTFEEDKINGGYDNNFTGKYWLYINEANEQDFEGKAIPFNLYSDAIKSLKFEILENTVPVEDNVHQLSTGIGFYYKSSNGNITEALQNQIVPVTSSEYSLYYGKGRVLSTGEGTKPSRTMVVYNPAIDNYIVRFDPDWKEADIKVFDMSGRIIQSQAKVNTSEDYILKVGKTNSAYIINAVSAQGEVVSTKIIR